VRLVLAGRALAEVRKELALTTVDERLVVDYLLHLAATATRAVRREVGPARPADRHAPPTGEVAEALAAARACMNLHPAPEQPGHLKLHWSPLTGRMARVRVVAHTCEWCVLESYELCASGGLMFIRRTDRTHARPVESVTEHLPEGRMMPLWARLISGQAR